jgi:hypothetical protein
MEKTHLSGRILGKPFLLLDFFKGMKEVTLERHPLYVEQCGKATFHFSGLCKLELTCSGEKPCL